MSQRATSLPVEPWLLPWVDNILLERSVIREEIKFLSLFGKSSSRWFQIPCPLPHTYIMLLFRLLSCGTQRCQHRAHYRHLSPFTHCQALTFSLASMSRL